MGTLIPMARPIDTLANQADHTYVKCGSGRKAWGCFGGKRGGRQLRRGTGSTNRADRIAQPDETAGLKCYLINGVCHQAANRILLPASKTVRGAHGYSISEALFGTYGRIGIWGCKSPFNKYLKVTGDLVECAEEEGPLTAKTIEQRALATEDKLDWHYIQGVLQIYDKASPMIQARGLTAAQASEFHLRLFMYMAKSNLGPMLNPRLERRLQYVRSKIEDARLKFEAPFAQGEANPNEFVEAFNQVTLAFQDEMANLLTPEQYLTLFDLKTDERVVLTDRKIISKMFKQQ